MRSRTQRGQATVELALCIPLLIGFIVLMIQVGVVMVDQIALTQVAREAARAAAVDPSPSAAVAAAETSTRLRSDRLRVEVGGRPPVGGTVEVTARYRTEVVTPFTGRVLLRPELTARAAMRVETGSRS